MLILLESTGTIWEFPAFLVPAADALEIRIDGSDGFWGGMLTAITAMIVPFLLIGLTGFSLARVYSESIQDADQINPNFESRDLQYLLPQNKRERYWTALLSISAGLTEELTFRLVLPLLVYLVTGSVTAAILIATIWFGMMHWYQGWTGVVTTCFVGALLMFVYILTRNIFLVMLIHAMMDLNELYFAPAFSDWLKKRQRVE